MLAGYLLWPAGTVDDPSSPAWISYQLQAGDTLQSAAARLGVDAGQLISSNRLDGPDSVFPGQVLQSSPPRDPGTLVLNISPWASVDALLREDGTQVLEGASLTPLRIDLAPGEYTVQASNPELGGEGMEFKFTIEAGEVKREFRKWPHVDLERELNRLFLSRSGAAEGTN
jgi:LysM repeat protein